MKTPPADLRALIASHGDDPAALGAGLLNWCGRSRPRQRIAARAVEAAQRATPELRAWLAERCGRDPETALDRLIRYASSQRREQARTRTTRRNVGFRCVHCGLEVLPTSHGPDRDHCPHCLVSIHVDIIPGDRRATCGGLMKALRVELKRGTWWLHHRCQRCGYERPIRAATACTVQPDRIEQLIEAGADHGR